MTRGKQRRNLNEISFLSLATAGEDRVVPEKQDGKSFRHLSFVVGDGHCVSVVVTKSEPEIRALASGREIERERGV